MTSIGASADMIALVQASTTLPIMLFSLMAGAIADNFDRRKLMLASQIFLLAVSVALTLCAYFGLVTPWLLLTFTFLVGCGTAFNGPGLAVAGRRDGAPLRPAGGHRPQQHGLQHRAQRRSGARRLIVATAGPSLPLRSMR